MVEKLLVATDGSSKAKEALEFALREFEDAKTTVIYVLDSEKFSDELPIDPMSEEQRSHASNVLSEAEKVAEGHGVEVETVWRVGEPWREIVGHAEEEGFDHVVVGSRGKTGVKRILLGSVAEGVVRRSPVPVTVVR